MKEEGKPKMTSSNHAQHTGELLSGLQKEREAVLVGIQALVTQHYPVKKAFGKKA